MYKIYFGSEEDLERDYFEFPPEYEYFSTDEEEPEDEIDEEVE